MRLGALLVFVAGCASTPSQSGDGPKREPTEAEKTLAALVTKSNRLTSFRALYELTDGSTGDTAALELAYRAPDRGKLAYPGVSTTYFAEGNCYVYSDVGPKKPYYALPYLLELAHTQETYAETLRLAEKLLAREGEPGNRRSAEVIFGLGGWDTMTGVKSLRTLVAYSTAPTRLGWLRAIDPAAFAMERKDGKCFFRRDGDGRFQPGLEIMLDENGFLERVRVIPPSRGSRPHPGFTLRLTSLTVDAPIDDAVFERPAPKDYIDRSDEGVERLRTMLVDSVQRGLLESVARRFEGEWDALDDARRAAIQELFESVLRVDVPRDYETEKLIQLLKVNLDKTLAQYRREKEVHANPKQFAKATHEKMRVGRESYLADVDVMEMKILADYGKFLERAFREFSAPAPGRVRDGLARLWAEGLRHQIDVQIRQPFASAFDERLKLLEEEMK